MIFQYSKLDILIRLLVAFILCGASFNSQAGPKVPDLAATAFYLLDANSGRVLASKNATEQLEPASITKIMTAYVLFAQLKAGKLQPDDLVEISEGAAKKGGSKMFIKAGSKVALKDLLRGMVVSSGNDATIALAEHIAGSEEVFSELMNKYAGKLGMSDTHFTNATGWPAEGHHTSARDIAIMSRALIENFPEYYKIFAEKSFTYGKSPKGKDITQPNRNSLLWQKGFKADGVKTGHTKVAGYCLAASATKNNMRLISVIMGTKSKRARSKTSRDLLNFGFRHFANKKLYNKDEAIKTLDVYKGANKQFTAGTNRDLLVTVVKVKLDKVKTKIEVTEPIEAPITKNQTVGKIIVTTDEATIAEFPLVALEEVPSGGFFTRMWDSLLLLVGL